MDQRSRVTTGRQACVASVRDAAREAASAGQRRRAREARRSRSSVGRTRAAACSPPRTARRDMHASWCSSDQPACARALALVRIGAAARWLDRDGLQLRDRHEHREHERDDDRRGGGHESVQSHAHIWSLVPRSVNARVCRNAITRNNRGENPRSRPLMTPRTLLLAIFIAVQTALLWRVAAREPHGPGAAVPLPRGGEFDAGASRGVTGRATAGAGSAGRPRARLARHRARTLDPWRRPTCRTTSITSRPRSRTPAGSPHGTATRCWSRSTRAARSRRCSTARAASRT